MKSAGICLALLVMFAPCAFSDQAAKQKPSPIDAVTFDFENMKILLQ
jgi:hypothetical protein